MKNNINSLDKQIYNLIEREEKRQKEGLELIPSENYVSAGVLNVLGSVLTNKYSEGYPKKRYYGGCEVVDEVEQLAIDRTKKLFKAEHVNVQPLSGAPANIAVYFALLKPGDTVLGMHLEHGGHLTHVHPVTHVAKVFNFIRYKTKINGEIDYDEIKKLAIKHKPKMILVGYSAYSREIDYTRIKKIADKVKALTMADIAHVAGLICAGLMNNPVPVFDVVTTTTHKTLRGPRGGMIMCKKKWADAIDKSVFPGLQGGPHENNIAAKAVAFGEALKPQFKTYAQQILKNAKVLEKEFRDMGYELCFGGTDNHLLLIDLTNKGIPGKIAQKVLDDVGISLNKNMVPNDPRSPFDPSGIRLGTPALTTRGMKEKEMSAIAQYIHNTLNAITVDDKKIEPTGEFSKYKTNYSIDKKIINKIRQEVKKLATKFPVPGIK